MRVDQAKNIQLFDLLGSLGHHPTATHTNGDVWYISPWRNEKTASFKINLKRNIWYDHGEGIGGNILDFVMRLENTDLRGALDFLDRKRIRSRSSEGIIRAPAPDLFDHVDDSRIEILEVKPVFSYPLKNYLRDERGIKQELGLKFLKEVRYRIEDKAGDKKEFYSLGFKNRSGGWALRNAHFTRAVAPNDITILERGGSQVKCFEGVMDFLSHLTVEGDKGGYDVIVLNSVSLQDRAIEFIRSKNYSEIHTYFDNDLAGEKTLSNFQLELQGMAIKPFNHLYHGHKDYNDLVRQKNR